MTRVRTIKEAASYFKSEDVGTCLTENAIRTLVRSGKVPCSLIGRKYLVSIEALEEYLQGKQTAEQPPTALSRQNTVWRIT